MYVIVSANEGAPLAGALRVFEAKSISPTKAVAYLDSDELRDDWTHLSEDEYLRHWNAARVSIDKPTITADGLDTATVVAVHSDLAEITFYHADTGEVITTVPVDPTTCTATLQVTATTPGVVRIRAGEPTATKMNEVVIMAR